MQNTVENKQVIYSAVTYDFINKGIIVVKPDGSFIFRIPKGGLTPIPVKKGFPQSRILTFNYYGSKRFLSNEWETILEEANTQGADTLIDCFGGSGVISLLAGRQGIYKKIVLNDIAYSIVNFHRVMGDDEKFKEFLYWLGVNGNLDEERFKKIKDDYKILISKRKQSRNLNIKSAVLFYAMQYYSYNGDSLGGYVKRKWKPIDDKEALKRTHKYYENIEVSQYHYMKLFKKYEKFSNALIVLDCPYLPETRQKKECYAKEMSVGQHRDLLKLVTKSPHNSKIVICGYTSKLYENYFLRSNKNGGNWHRVDFVKVGRKGSNKAVQETMWVNFDVSQMVANHSDMFTQIY